MSTPGRFAVIGQPVSHSLSPKIHQQFAEQTGISLVYGLIEGDEARFEQQVADFFKEGGQGLNVTLPFKQRAFALATVRTERCTQAKAANTLWWQDGVLHADNTDGIGLVNDLSRHMTLLNKSCLIFGAGGAVRGIIGPLLNAGLASITIVNRNQDKALALQSDFPKIQVRSLDDIADARYDLIINGTSASFIGEPLLLPPSLGQTKPFCYDLAYRMQGATPFVASAIEQGCQAYDGLGMLIEQAAEAFYIWHGVRPGNISLR